MELHVLLECTDGRLEGLRMGFMDDAAVVMGHGLGELWHRLSSSAFMDMLMSREKIAARLVEYVYEVSALAESVPMLILADEAAFQALPV